MKRSFNYITPTIITNISFTKKVYSIPMALLRRAEGGGE
jgi:hypothetical protein